MQLQSTATKEFILAYNI